MGCIDGQSSGAAFCPLKSYKRAIDGHRITDKPQWSEGLIRVLGFRYIFSYQSSLVLCFGAFWDNIVNKLSQANLLLVVKVLVWFQN